MPAAKPTKAADLVETDETDAPEETSSEVAVPLSAEEVEVSPSTRTFTAGNTWTAYYGNMRYDFIEGRKYDISPDAYEWFSSAK